jgi:hypothetical protein
MVLIAPRRDCRVRRYACIAWAGIAWTCLLATPAHAIEQMKMQLAALDGEGWHAEQVELLVNLGASPITAHLSVKQLQLKGVSEPAREVTIECPRVELSDERFSCTNARIAGQFPYIGKQRLNASASYARGNGAIVMQLHDL